jgi:hypothetical protein
MGAWRRFERSIRALTASADIRLRLGRWAGWRKGRFNLRFGTDRCPRRYNRCRTSCHRAVNLDEPGHSRH